MHTINIAQMPGPGDLAHFDPRFDDDDDALEVITEHVADERMTSATCIDDAFGDLTQEDFAVMAAALASGNPHRAGELLRDAVTRIVQADARKEARRRLERMHAEDEADAAAARMGH